MSRHSPNGTGAFPKENTGSLIDLAGQPVVVADDVFAAVDEFSHSSDHCIEDEREKRLAEKEMELLVREQQLALERFKLQKEKELARSAAQRRGTDIRNEAENRSQNADIVRSEDVRNPFLGRRSIVDAASAWNADLLRHSVLGVGEEARRSGEYRKVPKLPDFSGNSREWPIFIQAYLDSTKRLGITDSDNMYRLAEALTGVARSSVEHMLYDASNLVGCLETLRAKFGNPQKISNDAMNRIMQLPKVDHNFLTLTGMANEVSQVCYLLQSCGMEHDLQSSYFVHILEQKLNPTLNLLWGMAKTAAMDDKKAVDLRLFSSWLDKCGNQMGSVIGFSSIGSSQTGVRQPEQINHIREERRRIPRQPQTKTSCQFNCEEGHPLHRCPKFLDMAPAERLDLVNKWQRCEICLGNHRAQECSSNYMCRRNGCQKKHNSLLHGAFSVGTKVELITACTNPLKNKTLFKVIPVTLHNGEKSVRTGAFVDEGSSVTLLERQIAEKLDLDGPDELFQMRWTGDTIKEEQSKLVDFEIENEITRDRYAIESARTVDNLNLPTQCYNKQIKNLPHMKHLDPKLFNCCKPTLLLGLDNAHLSLPTTIHKGEIDEPVAIETSLGWAVYGKQSAVDRTCEVVHHGRLESNEDDNLEGLVNDYFADESFGVSNFPPIMSSDDQKAVDSMRETTSFTGNRYEAGLPWKKNPSYLPDNLSTAKRRWKNLMERLDRNPEMRAKYNATLEDYITKGYIAQVPDVELKEKGWILPTFIVQNAKKMRIVWDAAAEVNGQSLNSFLLSGPDLLSSLAGILYRFREYQIGLCGDIREMFHQVQIRKEDQPFQRFLWKREGDTEPRLFEMKVMIFGATSSPFMSQYIKNENAKKFAERYPEAVKSITKDTYVDDLLASFATIEKALARAREVTEINKEAGFEMAKWKSNSNVLQSELYKNTEKPVEIGASKNIHSKVLGLCWDTINDCFKFEIAEEMKQILLATRAPTKREVLRTVMSLFDPLGIVSFVIVLGKILLREIWRAKIGWDDAINETENGIWKRWGKVVMSLETLQIPRWYGSLADEELELHIFTDASENAFAAVAYAVFGQEGNKKSVLLGAKTKVAPLRAMTIPRLELQAAVLGVRLADSIQEHHTREFTSRCFWSDSRDVLCWIRSERRKYRQFVAFRIAEILNKTKCSEWRWVPTDQNPADQGTKWSQLSFDAQWKQWSNGPAFICQSRQHWPREMENNQTPVKHNFVGVVEIQEDLQPLIDWERYSRWEKVVRVYAFVMRFFNSCKRSPLRRSYSADKIIERGEFLASEDLLIRQIQKAAYGNEIKLLESGKCLSKKYSVHKLNPFLDDDGILRHRGRIQEAQCVSMNTRCPIILPSKHKATRLIVEQYHRKYLHANLATVLNELRQRFYINRVRSLVKQIRRSCPICTIRDARPTPPQMADLPLSRTSPHTAPFSYTGIDYFGPILVTVGRRTEKRWGVLFTCFNTRAVHIEVAHSLTTSSMILAFRNFVNRRGNPIEIYTDNGTNLKGAANLLRRLNVVLDPKLITGALNQINWKFIPPSAAHMGGVWERQIGSIKRCLENMDLPDRPNDEILRSYLVEAEGIINSRPLTYVSLEPDDPEALTPNHFLIGYSGGSRPLIEGNDGDLRRNWQMAQKMAHRFWERWIKEYLPDLTRRSKWYHNVSPLKVGDLVIVFDEQKPNSWTKGIITETITGRRSDQVREVKVRTRTGEYWRPAIKVALLDFVG